MGSAHMYLFVSLFSAPMLYMYSRVEYPMQCHHGVAYAPAVAGPDLGPYPVYIIWSTIRHIYKIGQVPGDL